MAKINSSYLNEVKNATSHKDLCTFCFEEVGHFARHLFTKHASEDIIKKISMFPLKSNERRMAIIALRKKGNFLLNQEQNKLKPVRNPPEIMTKKADTINTKNYYPCVHCLGYYKKSYLWRHKKKCHAKLDSKNTSRKQHLSEAQTLLASTGLLGDFLKNSRLKADVFSIMRGDEISLTAKQDPLICLFGQSLLAKHKRKQMNVAVSNKMREVARLKIALQKSTTITNLMEVLKPEMYNNILASCKIISGYDNESKRFQASSLPLHLGTSLKFICNIALKALITKNPIFAKLADDDLKKKKKEIKELKDMIVAHWCNDISSLAHKDLNEKKLEKPKLLPLTEDVQKFNSYILKLANTAYENLKVKENDSENYKLLAECALGLTLVFNRKRIGEVQFLDIKSYEQNLSTITQEECLSSLSEFEKSMSATFKRVVVFGKGSKPVALLFTKKMQNFIDKLIHIRKITDIVPKENKYVFANPGSVDRWMNGASVVRKFAQKCGARNPELLTSTRFRKQIATILQLMNFEQNEMEQIARFMGHTEKTHMEFYR